VQTTLAPGRYYRKASSGAAGSSSTALAPSSTPPQIAQALVRDGMDARAYLGPGRPLAPAIGYSGRPRSTDYPMSVNIATQGRSAWGRPSYEVLKKIIDAYDVARMCVNHKIDELRSMEPMFLPADGAKDDVDDEIAVARLVLAKPDRELPFESWLSKWLENAVKFDSAPLYRRRNYGGDVMALEVVDGKSIHPYIDENGRRPEPGSPAYYQTVHGMVAQWLTTDDLVFEPFRPQEDSPYGLAPIESILLTANTDLRFQWHFLQMFTDGSVPAGFMELPPDISSPEQVAEWQDFWDAMILGDQAKLSQLIAVPNGTKFTETKPRTFDEKFPEYLMSRTCAAFGVVPQDLGLVKDVNRANGETQVDVQFRVNTLPWVRYVEGVLTRYLQQDIGLRVKVNLDTGRDKEDRLAEAQAWEIYIASGMASPDEGRSQLLGLPIDKERPTPRFFSTPRIGAIPLLAIEGVAGRTDPETFGPRKDQPVLDQPYVPPIGVIPTPGTTDDKASLAATDQYQIQTRRALQAQDGGKTRESDSDKSSRGQKAEQDQADALAEASDVTEAAGAQDGPAPDEQQGKPVAKGEVIDGKEAEELAAFRTFVAGRVRKGEWRDFAFYTLPRHIASELNRGGRSEVTARLVAKAAKPSEQPRTGPAAAGIAVRADDTGRVLMLQRGLDAHDPASGSWEFPGGCLEEGEPANLAARREWEEEVGCALPDGEQTGSWTSSNGVYAGFVWTVPSEHAIRIDDPRDRTINPDDPGRDHVEAIAWWDPAQLPGNPALRSELAGDIDRVSPQLRGDQVAKAAADPKASVGQSTDWPGWRYDLAAAAYWGPRIATAVLAAVDVEAIAQAWIDTHHGDGGNGTDQERRKALAVVAASWLTGYQVRINAALRIVLSEIWTDGYAIGTAAADALTSGQPMDVGDWAPGEIEAADRLILARGDAPGLRALFEAAQHTIGLMADSRTEAMARALADAVVNGRSSESLGAALRALLADPDRAVRLALSELTRSSSAGAHGVYGGGRGVAATRWLTAEDNRVCAICDANANAGRIPLGMPYPSGDMYPPAHPGGCRCATIPG
jgi:8-oxo-dGTP pyrophosphatase MutT (NUDIX family)